MQEAYRLPYSKSLGGGGGNPPWLGGVPTLAGGYPPWGVPTLAWGTYLGQGVHLGQAVPTLVGGTYLGQGSILLG